MDRREFLGAVAVLPTLAGAEVEATPDAPKKLQRFHVSVGDVGSGTKYMEPGEARQFLLDATRDMATVLGQGKVYPARVEPQWLTDAVDAGVEASLEEARERERRWLAFRLRQLDGK